MGGEQQDAVAVNGKETEKAVIGDDAKESQASMVDEKNDGALEKKSSEFPSISYFSLYRYVSAIFC